MAIVTRGGAAGPRAAVAGTGLDVWEIVQTLRLVGNDLGRAARYLEIAPEAVGEALEHASAHPGEVEGFIARTGALADEDLRRWREDEPG